MTVRSQTRDLPPLQVRASFEPATLDREKRTVEVTWSAGARVLRGWWDRFWEELSLDPAHVHLDRLNNGAPFLADHNGFSVKDTPAVVERAWLAKGDSGAQVGRALVRFVRAGLDPDADLLFEKIADKIVANCSVGYRVHKMEKIEDAEDGIPVMRATSWTPHEVSAVAIGADDDAGFRAARSRDDAPNQVEVITRGVEPHQEKHMPEEVKQPPVPANAGETRADEEKVQAELQRGVEIRKIAKTAGLGDEFAEKLVTDRTPLDKARTIVIEEWAKRTSQNPTSSHLRIEGGEDQRDKFVRGAEAWLVQRAGKGAIVAAAAKAGKVTVVESDPGEFRGLTLIGLAREALERAGVNTRRLSDERIAELALSRRGGIGGMATASDFPVLLENVTNKVLLAAYEVAPHEWDRFCARGSVSNFHEHNRYRPGAFGTLDDVNDHGELKRKSIPDGEKRAVTIGTKGNTIGITRRTIIQDDMGVFTNLAGAFGMAAQNTIETTVWSKITANAGLGADYGDSNPLFHSSRSNINTVGSALSVAGLDADRVIMKRQPAPSGTTKLNLAPAILVVPTELGGEARVINEAQYDNTTNKLNVPNKARGLFRDIVDTAQLTGTRRYLFADPAVAPVIEVTFLEGQEAPQMESQEGFEVLGLQWRVFLDFGVNLVDYRGCVTNAGA
jgi:hypothetical protein